jgi:hypothetical protein
VPSNVQIKGAAGPAPQTYLVPNATEIIPRVINATFDGSGAAVAFVPTLEIVSDGGVVVARIPCGASVPAGGSAEVSFFPDGASQASVTAAGTSAVLTATAAGSTTVVAAQAGLITRVVQVGLMADSAVNVKFSDGTSDLTGSFPLAANTGFVLGYSPDGWFSTKAVNRPVQVVLSGVANVGGVLVFETAVTV